MFKALRNQKGQGIVEYCVLLGTLIGGSVFYFRQMDHELYVSVIRAINSIKEVAGLWY